MKKIIIYSDGAARGNPGKAGIGGLICDDKNQTLLRISEYIGEATNNVAEYKALILCLESSLSFGAAQVAVYLDSQLIVRQLQGSYRVKDQKLKPLYEKTKSLLRPYQKVEIFHIEREENKEADKLANQAIDLFEAGKKAVYSFGESSQAKIF
ncbi:MAG: ribonuclease HI family protein [Actinobacteria bacterium]|nr:ribonuclease HI family protein [Actinomycetota bacterium]